MRSSTSKLHRQPQSMRVPVEGTAVRGSAPPAAVLIWRARSIPVPAEAGAAMGSPACATGEEGNLVSFIPENYHGFWFGVV